MKWPLVHQYNWNFITVPIFQVTRSDNNLPININQIVKNTAYQLVTIETERTLTRGSKYIIKMSFEYTMTNEVLKGFYLSSYLENGQTKYDEFAAS